MKNPEKYEEHKRKLRANLKDLRENPERKTEYEEYKRKARARLRKMKEEAINHYGGKCACCGEDEMLFLSIDHIRNDGAEDRRKHPARGYAYFRRIVKENDFSKFQVLCFNCNMGRFFNGGICPHKSAEKVV